MSLSIWDDCPHHERPEIPRGKPFAYFQWNYGWGIWEQVVDGAARDEGVVAAYAHPAPASVDTLPKGQDAKQGLAGTEGNAQTHPGTPHDE